MLSCLFEFSGWGRTGLEWLDGWGLVSSSFFFTTTTTMRFDVGVGHHPRDGGRTRGGEGFFIRPTPLAAGALGYHDGVGRRYTRVI